MPSNGYPSPPDLKHITKVGVLRKTEIEFELIQKSDYFGMSDAMDGVIALGWELDDNGYNKGRLVFRFGESEESVKNKLYKKIKDKTIGPYIGRWNPDMDSIHTDIPDSDEEN